MVSSRLKFALLWLIVTNILFAFFGCSAENETYYEDIQLADREYNLAVGESITLDIEPYDAIVSIEPEDDTIIGCDGMTIMANRSGETSVEVRTENTVIDIDVRVYDCIVSTSAKEHRFDTIGSALQCVGDDMCIFIENGDYDESLEIMRSVKLVGEGDVTIRHINVSDGLSVSMENIDFYSSEYPLADEASLVVGEQANLTLSSVSFFVDKKMDSLEDRIGGYAIYVCPNSSYIHMEDVSIEGYNEGVYIASTGGHIDILSSHFSSTRMAISIDVRDGYYMPQNRPAQGTIHGNTFHDVECEIELIFNGQEYEGDLQIEKHDRIE